MKTVTAPAAVAAITDKARERQHQDEVRSRLRKASGQLNGVTAMYENGRYCIDVLDQISAVSAALDAIALLIVEDHVHTCVRAALDSGDADGKVAELITTVNRYLRTR